MKQQMLRFGMSGVAGYIVDSVVLYLVMALGMGFLRGRLVSFVCAVIATFVLNRRYTFAAQLIGAPGLRPPLALEFARYIAAMALGGLLNLATYWFVLRVTPHFPALFALAVAAGSLVGMVVNFATAKWWVFVRRPERSRFALPRFASLRFTLPRFELTTARALLVVQAVFWIAHLTETNLPGLYMDAANPDYLAASTLNPELPNPVWLQPTTGLPVIGSLYHGVQNYYVGLPVYALLGFNMLALRVAQGLFASGILVMMQLVLQRASGSLLLAFAGSLAVATELAFIASFRTQMYIVMSGTFWLLLAIYLALGRRNAAEFARAAVVPASTGNQVRTELPALPMLFSGACAGLAVYSYFVFLFFVPIFVVFGWWHTRNWRTALAWCLGFALGMQTYVLGYALAIIALGGIGPTLEWLGSSTQGLEPMSSELTIAQRIANAWSVLVMTLQNIGNELVIFGASQPARWVVWKVRLLASVPPLVLALAAFQAFKQRARPDSELRAAGLLANWHMALLPVAFVATTLIFGDRLWSHHFSSMIPLAYLVMFLAVHQLQAVTRLRLPKWAGVALMSVLVVGNVHQQQVFFERLTATGGAKYYSNAMNRLADDALGMPVDLVHMFPEWGFGMPFALLTGNKRTYDIDISATNLQRLADAGSTMRLYYWQPESESDYRAMLLANGYRISDSGTYLQRDQEPAFYWLEASAPSR